MPRQYTPRVPRVCEVCGASFSIIPSHAARTPGRFCSRDCYTSVRRTPIEERFWPKVEKTETCWIWTARKTSLGYGRIGRGGAEGGMVGAHRVAWELTYGSIPPGLEVMHDVCDNPSCVRPDHLKLGTHAENQASMARKGRSASGDRNGPRAHPECLPRGDQHWSHRQPEKVMRGEGHANARLTEVAVLKIRAAFDNGERSAQDLAADYHVSEATIFDIVHRRTWKHLLPPRS